MPVERALESSAKKRLELKYDGVGTTEQIVAGEASLEIMNPRNIDKSQTNSKIDLQNPN